MDKQITAITTNYYVPKAIDNIFNSNFLLSRLRKNQKSIDGGEKIYIPLEYAELTSGGSFKGLEPLNTTVNDVVTGCSYDWCQYYVTLGWSRRDYLINKGSKQKIVDLVSTVTKNASKKMQKNLTTGIFQATKASSTDIDGLITAICAAGSTSCGGLTSTDISTWTPTRDTTTTKLSRSILNSNTLASSDSNDTISVYVTTDAILGYYYDLATPQERYVDSQSLNAGFTGIMTFNGKPIYADKSCASGYLFGLNEDHVGLAVHSDEDMRYQPTQTPLNQAAELGQIFWMGNMYTDARRRNFVNTAIAS